MDKIFSSAAIQVIPIGIDSKDKIYSYVDKAIDIIKESGLKYEVTPFETVIEGELEEIVNLIQKIQTNLINCGLKTVCTNIKLWSGEIGSMEEKTGKYKNKALK